MCRTPLYALVELPLLMERETAFLKSEIQRAHPAVTFAFEPTPRAEKPIVSLKTTVSHPQSSMDRISLAFLQQFLEAQLWALVRESRELAIRLHGFAMRQAS